MVKDKMWSWILNHKGLTVHSKHSKLTEDTIRIKYGDKDYRWSDLLLDIYANFSTEPPADTKLAPVKLADKYEFIPKTTIYSKWQDDDLFILTSPVGTKISVIKKELKKLTKLRKAMKDRFLGTLFCDWLDDQGPVPVFNNSPVEEAASYQMATQGLSMAAMGQSELPEHVVGPIPVPGSKNHQYIVYSFTRKANDSEDPRIQKGGRPGALFLTFSMKKLDKEVLEFIEGFLSQWKAAPDLTENGLENLHEQLCMTITLAWDLIKYREEQHEYLRELVTRYHSELLLLRQENLNLHMELREVKNR
ncbi:MAG: hypothetical protein ACXAEU_08210 [Candidatus Hodarchaeales archaeon]|jgi:hypothetical protein